ncbi:MAG: hypothetical protein HYY06_17470 [Deltaproteobacteria bacterium]|nr:hypothetical protein [Deltaproteobacteria bacterium]
MPGRPRTASSRPRPFEIGARSVLVAVAALPLVSLGLAIAGRIGFPYPLEWMEGVVLEHAARLLAGEPLYGPPSGSFVPLVYAPMSYGVMAVFLFVGGTSLAWARASSVAATAFTIFAVGALAARGARAEHRPWTAILAAGLYAAGFAYGGTFYDLCRVDAVAIALLAAAVTLVRPDATRSRSIAGFLLFALAVLAKQQVLPVMVAATALALRQRRLRLSALIGWAALALLAAAIQVASNGWFWTYAVTIPGGHELHPSVAALSLVLDFAVPLPLLVVASGIALVQARRSPEPLHAAVIGGVVAAVLGRAHQGGFENVLLTAFVFLAPCAAATIARWALDRDLTVARRALVLAALVIQLLVLITPPRAFVPTRADLAAWRRAERALRECARGGRAVALDHAGLGGTRFAHTMAISDVLTGARRPLRQRTEQAVVRALDPEVLGAVGVGDATFPAMDRALLSRFEACAQVAAPPMQAGHDPGRLRIWAARGLLADVVNPVR